MSAYCCVIEQEKKKLTYGRRDSFFAKKKNLHVFVRIPEFQVEQRGDPDNFFQPTEQVVGIILDALQSRFRLVYLSATKKK